MKKILLFIILSIVLMSYSSIRKINIWMIGDSTMAWKKPERDPESGWGVEFREFVNENAIVHNHAASGRSTKSFVSEKRWNAVYDSIQSGDYVIIQFGHNDEKTDSLLHTDPYTSYKQYLKKFIDETRSKGGIPVICTSIVRRQFDDSGKLINTHGEYINAARQAAIENKTYFVDMEALTRTLIEDLGPENSKKIFVFCNPGECPKRPRGASDSTHPDHYGALQIAALFVNNVKEQKLPLAAYLQ